MALTLNTLRQSVFGNRRVRVLDATFDNSYAAGGLALTPALLGMQEFDLVLVSPAGGYLFEYDYTNQKLKAINPRAAITGTLAGSVAAGATAVTSSAANGAIVNLTGVAGVAAGAGSEVAATTDLTAVKVRVFVIGV